MKNLKVSKKSRLFCAAVGIANHQNGVEAYTVCVCVCVRARVCVFV